VTIENKALESRIQSRNQSFLDIGDDGDNSIKDKRLLSVLPEGSFFGDYQILFGITSSTSYISLGKEPSQIMSIDKFKFLSICRETFKFKQFLTRRAYERRKYFNDLSEQELIKI
jgi:hypothetical protein